MIQKNKDTYGKSSLSYTNEIGRKLTIRIIQDEGPDDLQYEAIFNGEDIVYFDSKEHFINWIETLYEAYVPDKKPPQECPKCHVEPLPGYDNMCMTLDCPLTKEQQQAILNPVKPTT